MAATGWLTPIPQLVCVKDSVARFRCMRWCVEFQSPSVRPAGGVSSEVSGVMYVVMSVMLCVVGAAHCRRRASVRAQRGLENASFSNMKINIKA